MENCWWALILLTLLSNIANPDIPFAKRQGDFKKFTEKNEIKKCFGAKKSLSYIQFYLGS